MQFRICTIVHNDRNNNNYNKFEIRTDKEIKEQAENIFAELGLKLTTAINMFLRAGIRENGIPFQLKLDSPYAITQAAIEEGRRIATDPNVKGYKNMEALKVALDA